MTAADIHRLVALGEGPSIEFKKRTPEPARLAKEVIAFANTNGGKLFLGVDDDGTVLGVKDSSEEEFMIRQALDTHCRPLIHWTCERIPITRKRDVLAISVPRSRNKPHYLVGIEGKSRGIAYVRVEDMSIESTTESLRLMRAERSQEDVQFEFGKTELQLMRYLERYGRISVEQLSRQASLSIKEAVHILVTLTRARILLHRREPKEDYFILKAGGEN